MMKSARSRSFRFWVSSSFAAIAAALGVLTMLVPDWIEVVFRVDPDAHTGWLEWMVVIALAVVAVAAGGVAWRERHVRTDSA